MIKSLQHDSPQVAKLRPRKTNLFANDKRTKTAISGHWGKAELTNLEIYWSVFFNSHGTS